MAYDATRRPPEKRYVHAAAAAARGNADLERDDERGEADERREEEEEGAADRAERVGLHEQVGRVVHEALGVDAQERGPQRRAADEHQVHHGREQPDPADHLVVARAEHRRQAGGRRRRSRGF
jgi:hypothetical protein